MEFYDLGAICFVCNRQDYLPWKCNLCNKQFCKNHIKDHKCINKISKKQKKQKKIRRKMVKCNLCKKKVAPLLSINCSYCYNQYCIPHRQPEIHNCKGLHKNIFKKNILKINKKNNIKKKKKNSCFEWFFKLLK